MGIALWYPLPFMRVPIRLARGLGNITAKYRWFAALYLILCFLVLPVTVFALSLAGWEVLVGVGVPILVFAVLVIIINVMQSRFPRFLPGFLRSWDFLPRPLHSLAPWDAVVTKAFGCCSKRCCCCCKCCKCCKMEEDEKISGNRERNVEMYDNPAMSRDEDAKVIVSATQL